jgi:hypothetical protein
MGYDEIMKRQRELNRIGIEYLEQHGYKIGDTVYMDGVLEGTINGASGDMIQVALDPVAFAAYRNEPVKQGVNKIIVPCHVDNFTSNPLSFDEGA